MSNDADTPEQGNVQSPHPSHALPEAQSRLKSGDVENVASDTLAHLAHARRLDTTVSPPLPAESIGTLLKARTLAAPDKNWLTYYDENGRAGAYTYAQFGEVARKLAGLLQAEMGLEQGDRIATLMGNDPRTVLAYFAAWMLGATVVPINTGESEERIHYILQHARVKVLIVPAENREKWNGLTAMAANVKPDAEPSDCQLPVMYALPTTLCDYATVATCLPTDVASLETVPDIAADAECLIVYTSGTTGAPKGVVLEQQNLLYDAQAIADWMGFIPEDRAMNVLPLHHVNGTVVTLMTPLVSGGSVVINRKFSVQSFWHTLDAERCTWVSVVPTVLAFLCERNENLEKYDPSRFKRILCGAGPLTVELARRFYTQFGLRITHGYGLSETTCYSSFLPAELTDSEYDFWMHECGFPSIGCPLPINEMAIHDANGNTLPPDTRGEIVIRGVNVMRYYYGRPDVNRETFAHGWFRSGDEGFYRVGAEGCLYFFITGRLKELIIRGGINLSPFDIDEVLTAIPGVRVAMAVGFENDFYGEEVGAYVQREESHDLTEEDILRACRLKLSFAKSPKVVVFGETFPVTSTGKYQRSKLRPLFAQWKNTQFRETK